MASFVTPKKGAQFVFYVGLVSQASAHVLQSNPTLASGDVKVAIDDGAPANMTTLPVVDGDFTKRVKVSLSSDEMNGDNISIIFSDASGDEWDDLLVNIQTSARQVDDLAFPNTSGRGIDVSTGGEVGLDWANVGSPTTTVGLSGTTVKTATDVETDTADIQARLPAALTGDGNIKADALKINGATPNDLSAAGVRAAVGLASANLDTQLDALPTANENADALLDRTNGIETSTTLRQSLRLILASLVGELSGANTTEVTIRDINDTVDRIVATVDQYGNRSAVTTDVS